MRELAYAVQMSLSSPIPTPVLVWGSPGVGKSAYIRALGAALGLPVEVVIASIREPSDFSGLPVLHDGSVRFAPPAWAKRLAQAGKGILFLDEISTAPPAVQAALLRVVLDRVVGDLELPKQIAIVAAANPPDEAAGGWELTPPLANRFIHLEWSPDPAKWVDGMIAGWPTPAVPSLPANWEARIPEARALVAAFIKARPHLLLKMPKSESETGRAWPSPRTWEMAAICWAATKHEKEVASRLIAGCVGEGAALEFLGWVEEMDLPDPRELLKQPSLFKLPPRGDRAYAILSGVVAEALNNLPADWMPAWEILYRAAEQGGADIAAAAAKQLANARKKDPSLPLPKQFLSPFVKLLKGGDDA